MSNKLKRWGLVILAIVLLTAGITYLVGDYFVNFALVAGQGAEDRDIDDNSQLNLTSEDAEKIKRNYQDSIKNRDVWLETVKPYTEEISVTSTDGLTLNGHAFYQPESTDEWMIIVHGYQSNEADSHLAAPVYYDAGMNVLTFTQRAHKGSDGKYITMGAKEADDLIQWTKWIVERHPNSQIVYHGTSMGAATVMIASDHPQLPEQVKVIIEDCGYDSTWDVFARELKGRFKLPSFPIMNMAELMAAYRADFWLSENNPIEHVERTTRPMLFIHGDHDDFVPVSMAYNLYEAYPTDDKALLIIEGAGHDDSKYLKTNRYYDTVFEFIESHLTHKTGE